jgi:hypothetical protein|tara:strand:+ start:804 stop:980 length:177 start_codon:yes stop_codon:yes gene_type:complete
MDTYLPMNGVNAEICNQFNVVDYEIKRLREANANLKLQVLDLRKELNEKNKTSLEKNK